MIVPAMTEQEIRKEMLNDIKNLRPKVENFQRKFRAVVLRTSKFPACRFYECLTEKKNLFVVGFTADRRGQHSTPNLGMHCVYERPEGKYAAVWTYSGRMILFPPHFFDRYQERVLKDVTLSRIDVIRQYLKNNPGQAGLEINDDVEAVFKCFEGHYSDEVISLVFATSQGYCFGENHGDVTVMKTIITEDMLSDRQRQLFPAIRELFIQSHKNIYGSKWIPSDNVL